MKKKLSVKALNEKYKVLKGIDKGLSYKDASQPIQLRLRSKIKRSMSKLLMTIVPEKKRKLRKKDFEKLDNIAIRWILSKRSQNIPIDGNLIK